MKREKKLLEEKLYEVYLHKKRLESARHKLKFIMPLNVEKYKELDDIFIAIIDQMLFRFSKLQDTLGEKIFPLILYLQEEPIKKMSFIDRLNRLEELEILDKNKWMQLRNDRNEIAHEYSYNEKEVVDNINTIYNTSQELIEIFDSIYNYSFHKFDISISNNGKLK